MNILAIETSCDETAAAVVKDGTEVLSNVVATSSEMHAKTGGIIPEIAARQQVKSVMPVVDEALKKAFSNVGGQVDAIAVTVGPGLIGSLLVGVETAKTLARLWDKPVIPVNHMMGHIYACWLNSSLKVQNSKLGPEFPLLALVVSGGHTDLIYMKGHGKAKLIGTTRDDAAGECFDKCARLLGLPYPGGPAIAAEAAKFQSSNVETQNLRVFPRPMINSKDFDWSFSGLKTAVLNRVKEQESGRVEKLDIEQLAAEVQEAICEVLVNKSIKAVKKCEPKSFLLSGGVAANKNLREKFADEFSSNLTGITLHVPEPKYCTDNAAMIGAMAYYLGKPVGWENVFVDPQLSTTD